MAVNMVCMCAFVLTLGVSATCGLTIPLADIYITEAYIVENYKNLAVFIVSCLFIVGWIIDNVKLHWPTV